MAADWYPSREDELSAWHVAFVAALNAYSAALGLAAGVVTQATADSTMVAATLGYLEQAQNFAQEVRGFKDQVLHGALNTPNPVLPNAPSALAVPLGWLANVEARTRQLVAQVKANPAYTAQMGLDMGIVGGVPAPGPVSMTATALTQSQVAIKVSKQGNNVVAVDSRRGGGAWEQIALLTNVDYVDGRAPLVAGQPEQREYRCQAYENNQRTGPISAVVSAVTVP